jgi:hypothetical protein
LDGRIVPSVVSGNIAVIHRGDYLVGNSPEDDEAGGTIRLSGGSKPGAGGSTLGGTKEGIEILGSKPVTNAGSDVGLFGGSKPSVGGGGALHLIGDTITGVERFGASQPGVINTSSLGDITGEGNVPVGGRGGISGDV